MEIEKQHDLIIVGGGIGGIISLKYAKDAGLDAILLEGGAAIGGLWRDLPVWQDIQLRKEDWTLGDLPISGEDQPSILANIRSWVERFCLAPYILLNTKVTSASPSDGGWQVNANGYSRRSKFLIAATGGHNRPSVPLIERVRPSLIEYHSSALRDPDELTGKNVVVVGGGASAYDLLDLCFERQARNVTWVYRSLKWMLPTLRPKYQAAALRALSRTQMLGISQAEQNKRINRDLRARYKKAGIEELMPDTAFDIGIQQLIPGRRRMLQNFTRILRYRSEIIRIEQNSVLLSSGHKLDADMVLWGTGYETDISYLKVDNLSRLTRTDAINCRCGWHVLSLDAPNLFLLAPGVLETTTSTPWAYAHVAKSIMSHITGNKVFESVPIFTNSNHYELVHLFAKNDRANYPTFLWYLKYLYLAFRKPDVRPLPIP
ncbi:MAG: NAD(P)-binding domain-containing protein [Gallionella sp.]